jgi:hypothetical protein
MGRRGEGEKFYKWTEVCLVLSLREAKYLLKKKRWSCSFLKEMKLIPAQGGT